MKKVYIVSSGSANIASILQFAFHDLEEAQKFMDYLDSEKGASSHYSTLDALVIYDNALQLMKVKE